MPIHLRLRELYELLAAFLERPQPGVLVVRCSDDEMLYLVHVLEQLDADSPADRFLIAPDPFTEIGRYLTTITARIAHAADTAATAAPPVVDIDAILAAQLAALPAGDHRLVWAMVPTQIENPVAFAALAEPLLIGPFAGPLRLVLREDPRYPLSAADIPSTSVLVHEFSLPASFVVATTATTAADPTRPPDERAQAILQLAVREIGFGNHARALIGCDTAATLARSPALIALAFAIRADALRVAGHLEPALHTASEALHRATASQVLPVMRYSAMTLGEVAVQLGLTDHAIACFRLAENAAMHDPVAQTSARERRISIQSGDPC